MVKKKGEKRKRTRRKRMRRRRDAFTHRTGITTQHKATCCGRVACRLAHLCDLIQQLVVLLLLLQSAQIAAHGGRGNSASCPILPESSSGTDTGGVALHAGAPVLIGHSLWWGIPEQRQPARLGGEPDEPEISSSRSSSGVCLFFPLWQPLFDRLTHKRALARWSCEQRWWRHSPLGPHYYAESSS